MMSDMNFSDSHGRAFKAITRKYYIKKSFATLVYMGKKRVNWGTDGFASQENSLSLNTRIWVHFYWSYWDLVEGNSGEKAFVAICPW